MTQQLSLVNLIGLEKLKELQRRFYKATGFPNSFVDHHGKYVSSFFPNLKILMPNLKNMRCDSLYP